MSEFWVRTTDLDAVGSELRAAATQARNSAGDIAALVARSHLAESDSPHQSDAAARPGRLRTAADAVDLNWSTVITEIDQLMGHRIDVTAARLLDGATCGEMAPLPIMLPSQYPDAYDVRKDSPGDLAAAKLMDELRRRDLLPEPSPDGLTDPFSATDRLQSNRGPGETMTRLHLETSAGLDALGWAEVLATVGLDMTIVRHAKGFVEVTVGVMASADPEFSPNITVGPASGTVDAGIDLVGGGKVTWVFDSELHFQEWLEDTASVIVDTAAIATPAGFAQPTPEDYLERLRNSAWIPVSMQVEGGAIASAGITGTLPLSVAQLIGEGDIIVGVESFADGTRRVEFRRSTSVEAHAATVIGGFAGGSYTRRDYIYFDGIVPIAQEQIYEIDATFGPEFAGSLGVGWGIKASEALAYARRSGDDPGTIVIAIETRYDGSIVDIVTGDTTTTTITHIDGSSVEAGIETQITFGEIELDAGAEHTTVDSHAIDAGLDDVGLAILRYLGLHHDGLPVAAP